jgi:hypothetical protein
LAEFFDDQWPILYFELPPVVGPVELASVFAKLREYADRRQRFGLITDTTLMANTDFPAGLRSQTAAGIRELVDPLSPYLIAMAYVVPWAETRNIITAIHWTAPVPWAVRVFGLKGPAVQWIRDVIRDDAASLGPAGADLGS